MSTATYNRIYSTMFDGSLYGKGALVIACWAYVLAEMKPDFGKGQFYVTLNPKKVADALGEPQISVEEVIQRFCEPESDSQSQTQEGKKLIPGSGFDYLVVNGAEYNEIKKREAKRDANRVAQQRFRKKGKPLPGEVAAVKAEGNGDLKDAQRIAEGSLPAKSNLHPVEPSFDRSSGASSFADRGGAEPQESFEPGEQVGLPPGPDFDR